MSADAKNIDEAILRVMGKVHGVGKDKRNKEQNYAYTSETAVIEAVRPLMIEEGIVIHLAKIEELHREELVTAKGSKLARTWGKFIYELRHVHTGTFKMVEALGEGMDSGDKSVYKAQTGSRKNALFDAFQIPRTDDPENGNGSHTAEAPKAATGSTAAPARRETQPAKPWGQDGRISEKQGKRLFAISQGVSLPEPRLKAYLKDVHGLEHTYDIPWKKYDEICKWVENWKEAAAVNQTVPDLEEDDIPF